MSDFLLALAKQFVSKIQNDATGTWDGGEFYTSLAVISATFVLGLLFTLWFWWPAAILILPVVAYIYYTHKLFSEKDGTVAGRVSIMLGMVGGFILIYLSSQVFSNRSPVNPFVLLAILVLFSVILPPAVLLHPRYSKIYLKKSTISLMINATLVVLACLGQFSSGEFDLRYLITFLVYFCLMLLFDLRIFAHLINLARIGNASARAKTIETTRKAGKKPASARQASP